MAAANRSALQPGPRQASHLDGPTGQRTVNRMGMSPRDLSNWLRATRTPQVAAELLVHLPQTWASPAVHHYKFTLPDDVADRFLFAPRHVAAVPAATRASGPGPFAETEEQHVRAAAATNQRATSNELDSIYQASDAGFAARSAVLANPNADADLLALVAEADNDKATTSADRLLRFHALANPNVPERARLQAARSRSKKDRAAVVANPAATDTELAALIGDRDLHGSFSSRQSLTEQHWEKLTRKPARQVAARLGGRADLPGTAAQSLLDHTAARYPHAAAALAANPAVTPGIRASAACVRRDVIDRLVDELAARSWDDLSVGTTLPPEVAAALLATRPRQMMSEPELPDAAAGLGRWLWRHLPSESLDTSRHAPYRRYAQAELERRSSGPAESPALAAVIESAALTGRYAGEVLGGAVAVAANGWVGSTTEFDDFVTSW